MHNKNKIDPLLSCLVKLTKINGKPYSVEALTVGMPVENTVDGIQLFSINNSKSLFTRAAQRAGFSSTLVKKKLSGISPLVLPCILLLKGNNACILEKFNEDKSQARIIYPESHETDKWVDIDVLSDEYLGYCFYLKKEFSVEDDDNFLMKNGSEHWFWGTIKKSTKIYADVIGASLLVNIFVLAGPLFSMNIYDRVVPNNATETLWVLAIGVIVIYVLDLFLKFTRSYFLEIAAKKSDIIMSSKIFEKVMDFKMEVRPKSIGSFASNVREFDSLRGFFASSTIVALVDLPFAVIFLITIHFIAGNIVIVPFVIMIIILIYTLFLRGPLHKSIESTYKATTVKNGILIESLNAMETIKILGASGYVQWKWEEATGEIANRSIKSKMLSSSITTVTGFLIQLNTVFVVIMGVYMIKDMELTMGGLIASVILSSRAIAPMGQVASLLSNYEQTKTSYKNLNNIMNLPVERPDGKKFIRRDNFKGDIEFKKVSFSYPDAAKASLEDISFKIKNGEKVGILGRNGSGKTTLEKLMLGLYTPSGGSVLIDGIDVKKIDPADLRRNIGYVPQDVVLFKGTIKENIVYKAPHADDLQIIKAAKISGIDEFVSSHPLGFHAPVGERGDGISGGQRQGIAIARAFLLDSKIMLLDEPTNSLDSVSENVLKNSLKNELKDCTILLVTHKTSLLDLVDRLIIIDEGKIVLDGTKEEVLAKLRGQSKAKNE